MIKITKLPNDCELREYDSGFKFWCLDNKCHREDGPAAEWPDGHKEWYIYGKQLHCSTQKQFEQYMKLKAFW